MSQAKKLGLASKVFIGFVVGIIIGVIFGEKASVLKPLGTIFLNMIKMIVVPLVFCSITAGVSSLRDLRKLRKIGMKVVGLYALTSAMSVVIGLCMAYLINPGKGFDLSLLSGTSKYSAQNMPSVIDTLVTMFPENVFNSMVTTNLLQVIVFAVFLGTALIMMGG